MDFENTCAERLIRYARFDTQSDRFSQEHPTTRKQFDLARELKRELENMGASDVSLDEEYCVLYARIPSNLPVGQGLAFGLITHMDTSPDACSRDISPRRIHYEGGAVELSPGILMTPDEFPNLLQYVGQDLIVTDGKTLLGGDDKASIASVVTLAEHLLAHPEIPHPDVCLAFTPDEEVGGLARDLDFHRLGARIAYTLDGDHLGYWEDETFNASEATIRIAGRSVHPGTAKGIMINACDIAARFISMLPENEKPQSTDGREGFYHVVSCEATCESAKVSLIIRDHDAGQFALREQRIRDMAEELCRIYGAGRVTAEIQPSYRNMKEVIDKVPFMIQDLTQAIRDSGIEPHSIAFRGGTDGSSLSHRGLPCPNLSAGYENAHGRFEYVPVPSMAGNVRILIHLCRLLSERSTADIAGLPPI